MTGCLDHPVLVLNRFWQPVQTCSVRRALKLLFVGHAQVVQTEGADRFRTHDLCSWIEHSTRERGAEVIHTVRLALGVPKIIVLALYEKLPRLEVRFTRRNVFLRDKHTCQYCAGVFREEELNLDHVLPRDKGGRTTWENIVTSCIRCNTRKANKLTHEVNMHPLRKPAAPRWRPMFAACGAHRSDASWSHFIDPDPSTVRLSA